ncbi:MAG TPA: GNAT family N-acetyltransferase, partial [Acidothermaceae bacterium]
MADSIVVATTPSEYDAFGVLIREYWDWLLTRYSVHPGLMEDIGAHQGLDDELNTVATVYRPPAGKALLAMRHGQVSGGVGYRDLHDGSCEMKRMFVPERFQGHGTGRLLCEALMTTAADDGFRLMRLDTGYLNAEAMGMYASLGFSPCP